MELCAALAIVALVGITVFVFALCRIAARETPTLTDKRGDD